MNGIPASGILQAALLLLPAWVPPLTPSDPPIQPTRAASERPPIAEVPFELNANKPYLRVRVNRSRTLWLVLDAGSVANVMDARVAEALGITRSGDREVTGAGDGSLSSSTGRDVTLGVDGLELPPRDVEVVPLTAALGFAEGRTVDGLLGYEFFRDFVVEIDYAERRVRVHEPRSFEYTGHGAVIPLEIVRGNIFVSATLLVAGREPVAGRFLVDTGWRSALSLNRPFVESERLLATTRTIRATTGVGIGGPILEAVGRVQGLELGRYKMKDLVATFSSAKRGVLFQEDMAGVIGGEILRRFKAIFDYSRRRMILEQNPSFPEPY
jgi:hypothetical protein